jgi:hypothetical protein
MRALACLLLIAMPLQSVLANSPDCGHPDDWAATMAFTHLKNAGLVHNDTTDFSKTKVVQLVSAKTGKDLYRQVYKVTFSDRSGNTVEVITINDASHAECSESGVEVFVISKDLGSLNEGAPTAR